MKTITPEALAPLLAADPALPVIDVRTPLEFDETHLARSRNLPLDRLSPRDLLEQQALPVDAPIYLLCRSGQRATKAAERLEAAGFQHATVVTGGILAWEQAGLPVTRGESKVISLERQVRIGAGSLVFIGVLLGWFVHPGFFGLSGFVGAGLVFAGISDWCGMGLLLAKAPWNQRKSS
ncbi:MAG: ygaP 2 [Akkermansiaceae bacterium]|nr:ygaP 2 [Akkermansiaceae bacterium]